LDQYIQEIDKEANKIVRDNGMSSCPAALTKLLKEMPEDESGDAEW